MIDSEVRPGGEQFAENTGSDLARNTPLPPIAANLVQLMEQARAARQEQGLTEFYPNWWMYTNIVEVTAEMGGRNDVVFEALFDVSRAYGIAAYQQFTPRQKDQFRENLRLDIRDLNIGSVTLNEQQREILTHIGTATNTPIDPDQVEYQYATILTQPDITEEEMEQDPRYNT
jgi:hypothetical protein